MKYLMIVWLIAFHALASTAYAQGEAPAQVEVGSSLDTFDKSYFANWRGNYVVAEKKLGERHSVYGVMSEVERYSKKDTEFLAGYYYPLADRWTLFTEANTSPSHNILAIWSGIGQVQYAFDNGIGVHLGLRHTEYDSAVINILLLTCERYWSNYRAAYTHSTSLLANAGYTSNERIQLSRYYDDRSWIGVGISQGAEMENLGPPRGILNSTVQYAGLNGRHWISRDWALSYEAATNIQGSLYTRNGYRLGLRYQF